MFPITNIHFAANGNVRPCRFVAPAGGSLGVEASDPTLPILGLSYEETRYPPNSPADDGFVAIAGEPLPLLGPGQVGNVVLGDTVAANDPCTTDNQGRAIPVDTTATTKIWVAGFALVAGVVGDKVPFYVTSPFYQLVAPTA